jgi:hypothetical protein
MALRPDTSTVSRRDGTDRFLVQFPHPGAEHRPATDDMPWNVASHRRKFLISSGLYVDAEEKPAAGELVFWGEWEAPSRVERRWPTSGRLPRCLHRPYWITPPTTGLRQNTDPWVWGEQMLYSNCKQTAGPSRRATSMQRLGCGSVICFGSTIGGEFCLDTVFVVASSERWLPAHAQRLSLSDAFITCTADALMTRTADACGGCAPSAAATGMREGEVELTLYRAATVNAPIDGMYSFAPASKADQPSPRFERPAIRLPGLINPASRQSTRGSKRPLPPDRIYKEWCSLVDQVFDAGLVLGVSFETPIHGRGRHVPSAGKRGGC